MGYLNEPVDCAARGAAKVLHTKFCVQSLGKYEAEFFVKVKKFSLKRSLCLLSNKGMQIKLFIIYIHIYMYKRQLINYIM